MKCQYPGFAAKPLRFGNSFAYDSPVSPVNAVKKTCCKNNRMPLFQKKFQVFYYLHIYVDYRIELWLVVHDYTTADGKLVQAYHFLCYTCHIHVHYGIH